MYIRVQQEWDVVVKKQYVVWYFFALLRSEGFFDGWASIFLPHPSLSPTHFFLLRHTARNPSHPPRRLANKRHYPGPGHKSIGTQHGTSHLLPQHYLLSIAIYGCHRITITIIVCIQVQQYFKFISLHKNSSPTSLCYFSSQTQIPSYFASKKIVGYFT